MTSKFGAAGKNNQSGQVHRRLRKMSQDLNSATEGEKSLSKGLIALAGVIMAAAVALWPGLLSLLTAVGDRYASTVIVITLLLLLMSMIFGGRGIAYGPMQRGFRDRFNLQSTCGVIAILCVASLGIVILLHSEPSDFQKVETRLAGVETQISNLKGDLTRIENELSSAAKSLGENKLQLDGLGGVLNEQTANQNRIEESLGNLSEQIGDLQAAVAELTAEN